MGFWGGSGIRWTITSNLHLAPDRIHTNTSSLNFYRWDALPGAQPTVSKHWRCHSDKCKLLILTLSSCTAHIAVAYYYTATCLFCAPCLSVCSAHWLAPPPKKKTQKNWSIQIPYGGSIVWPGNDVFRGAHTGVTWRIWQNDPSVAARQTYAKLFPASQLMAPAINWADPTLVLHWFNWV